MSYKILTQNGIDNTNIDGARAEYFNSGMRDGIVKGAFNEGIFASNTSNGVYFEKCELRIGGHRVIVDTPEYFTFSNPPAINTRYSLVAQIQVDDNSNVDFSFIVQSSDTQLRRDRLYMNANGSGIYQIEIGRFTLTKDLQVKDLITTIDTITGSGSSGFKVGNVTTSEIDTNTEVDIDTRKGSDGREYIDFDFKFKKVDKIVYEIFNIYIGDLVENTTYTNYNYIVQKTSEYNISDKTIITLLCDDPNLFINYGISLLSNTENTLVFGFKNAINSNISLKVMYIEAEKIDPEPLVIISY